LALCARVFENAFPEPETTQRAGASAMLGMRQELLGATAMGSVLRRDMPAADASAAHRGYAGKRRMTGFPTS
jgi:hypothetical protein